MLVLLIGGSGFVGRTVQEALRAQGHTVRVLSRHPQNPGDFAGDVVSGEGLIEASRGVDAAIYLTGIIRQSREQSFTGVHVLGVENTLKALKSNDVKRIIHMSALSASSAGQSRYFQSKARGEELMRDSGLEWTIFQPSLIFGPGDGFFAGTLAQLVKTPLPFIPLVDRGKFLFRPVSYQDVALAFAGALSKPAAGKTFQLTGPQEYNLHELLLLVRNTLGLRKGFLPVPLPLMRIGVPLLAPLPNPPITRDEFIMLLSGNTAPPEPARDFFELPMISLEAELPRILGP